MGLLELTLIAVGLSMDAFAVAICKGLGMPKLIMRDAVLIALFFGVFQAVMPAVGWALGIQFQVHIARFDHWVAFGLLFVLGAKMIAETRHDDDDDGCRCYKLSIGELFALAVATSIDALAVGITFALLNVNIAYAVSFIGATTFILSFSGVLIGRAFGAKYKNAAQVFGGIILILIGVKILLEHLGVISF
ncbi:MAG: manganese efflux pump MntP family protein [Clostridia bacterium]|nr:manganese efflux pump MntP family protein [Clostridia bacterium]